MGFYVIENSKYLIIDVVIFAKIALKNNMNRFLFDINFLKLELYKTEK